jgi:hypothetical protein
MDAWLRELWGCLPIAWSPRQLRGEHHGGRAQAEGDGQAADPAEREMFERVAKLVKTDRVRSWRLDQAARSIFLTEFVSAFFLAMRYFFKPKVTR